MIQPGAKLAFSKGGGIKLKENSINEGGHGQSNPPLPLVTPLDTIPSVEEKELNVRNGWFENQKLRSCCQYIYNWVYKMLMLCLKKNIISNKRSLYLF